MEMKPCPTCGRDEDHHMFGCKNFMGIDGEWVVFADPESVTRKPEIGDWFVYVFNPDPGDLQQIMGYEDLMSVQAERDEYYVYATRDEAISELGTEDDY